MRLLSAISRPYSSGPVSWRNIAIHVLTLDRQSALLGEGNGLVFDSWTLAASLDRWEKGGSAPWEMAQTSHYCAIRGETTEVTSLLRTGGTSDDGGGPHSSFGASRSR